MPAGAEHLVVATLGQALLENDGKLDERAAVMVDGDQLQFSVERRDLVVHQQVHQVKAQDRQLVIGWRQQRSASHAANQCNDRAKSTTAGRARTRNHGRKAAAGPRCARRLVCPSI